jgi:hypothetical protein
MAVAANCLLMEPMLYRISGLAGVCGPGEHRHMPGDNSREPQRAQREGIFHSKDDWFQVWHVRRPFVRDMCSVRLSGVEDLAGVAIWFDSFSFSVGPEKILEFRSGRSDKHYEIGRSKEVKGG